MYKPDHIQTDLKERNTDGVKNPTYPNTPPPVGVYSSVFPLFCYDVEQFTFTSIFEDRARPPFLV